VGRRARSSRRAVPRSATVIQVDGTRETFHMGGGCLAVAGALTAPRGGVGLLVGPSLAGLLLCSVPIGAGCLAPLYRSRLIVDGAEAIVPRVCPFDDPAS
jgi:hypothetical protein